MSRSPQEPTEEVSAPLVFPYKAVAATCVRPSTSPMFTTIAGGALTAAMAPVVAAFPSFTSPMSGLFGAPSPVAEMHTESQVTTFMALETDSEAASPVEGAFDALLRAEQLQGSLLADLPGDITLSVPSLAEMAAAGSDSTQELPGGDDAAAMMLQVSFGSPPPCKRLSFERVERQWDFMERIGKRRKTVVKNVVFAGFGGIVCCRRAT